MSLADAPPHALPPVEDVGGGTSRKRLVVFLLLFLAVAALLRVPGFSNRVFNSDEAYLATQAEGLIHGEKLYVDTVDRKPPIVPYLYAAVFEVTGSDDLGPVRVLATVAMAVTALLVAAEASRRFAWRHAGLVGGLLYLAAVTAFRPLDAQAANFEVFALPLTTGAMLLAIRRRTWASGVVLALATLTVQSAAVVLLPVGWLAWRERRARGFAVLAAAYASPILVAAVIFGWRPFVRWVFTSNGTYLDWSGGLGYALRLGLSQSGWFALGSIALVLLLPFAWRCRREDAELWLWLASAAVAVVAGFRFFGHYYLQLVPPLTLLGVRGLVSRPLRAQRWVLVVVAGLTIVPMSCFLGLALASRNTKDTRIALAVGAYFAAHTAPAQRVLVWGQAPEAYWSSDRRPSVRFATTGFLTGSTGGRPPDHVGERYAVPGAWADFLSDLTAHPPVLIADMSTADQRHASYSPPGKYPQFAHFLERGAWKRVATVDGVAILQQKGR